MTIPSDLIEIYTAGLAAVDPYRAVLDALRLEQNNLLVAGEEYDLEKYKRIVVVGAGKATARMALAIEGLLGKRISAGLIIVKQGQRITLEIIQQVEAAHPIPNQAGVDGTQVILNMAQLADQDTLFICLLSGGASALLVAPAPGLTLADKEAVTKLLLKSGANIAELNAVRKHLSGIKGGRLARAAYPARTVTLILSDVIGDPLDVIASGPTVPDSSTFADAWKVIEKYKLQNIVPECAMQHLLQGLSGIADETVKQGEAEKYCVQNIIIGGNRLALEAAIEKSRQLGYKSELIKTDLCGEARDAADYLAGVARMTFDHMQPNEKRCLLSGGETTVTVKGAGMGGRNQELALAFAIAAEGLQGVSLLSAGTDGNDGANDAAGAIVSGSTAASARQLGISPACFLENNDSYHFFRLLDKSSEVKSHFISGLTGTNVMDIQIMLLTKSCDKNVM